jgi:septation ring formation regulator EzrA
VERLSRLGKSEKQYHRLEKAVQGLIEAHSKIVAGSSSSSLVLTGTSLDQLFPVLERGYHAQHVINQSIQIVDDIFVTQQRQQDHLSKLDASLVQSRQLLEDASQRCQQARQLGTQIMQKLRDLRKLMSREPRVGRAH